MMIINIIKKSIHNIFVSTLLALPFLIMSQSVHAFLSLNNNSDGTITETLSKLMWQRCTAPSIEANCTEMPSLYNWDNALAYCNDLSLAGHTDWRLPNVKELQSIVDTTKTVAPSINAFYFIDTQSAEYWSSTTSVGTFSNAWYVNFDISGFGQIMTSIVIKTDVNYVRCVRGI